MFTKPWDGFSTHAQASVQQNSLLLKITLNHFYGEKEYAPPFLNLFGCVTKENHEI